MSAPLHPRQRALRLAAIAAGLPVVLPGGVVLPARRGPDLATDGQLREALAWLA